MCRATTSATTSSRRQDERAGDDEGRRRYGSCDFGRRGRGTAERRLRAEEGARTPTTRIRVGVSPATATAAATTAARATSGRVGGRRADGGRTRRDCHPDVLPPLGRSSAAAPHQSNRAPGSGDGLVTDNRQHEEAPVPQTGYRRLLRIGIAAPPRERDPHRSSSTSRRSASRATASRRSARSSPSPVGVPLDPAGRPVGGRHGLPDVQSAVGLALADVQSAARPVPGRRRRRRARRACTGRCGRASTAPGQCSP